MIPAELSGAPYLRELARRLRKHASRVGGIEREIGREIRYAAICLDMYATYLEEKEGNDVNGNSD